MFVIKCGERPLGRACSAVFGRVPRTRFVDGRNRPPNGASSYHARFPVDYCRRILVPAARKTSGAIYSWATALQQVCACLRVDPKSYMCNLELS